jgi:beta-glucosidase
MSRSIFLSQWVLLMCLFAGQTAAQTSLSWNKESIPQWIAQMTIEEKAGQMTQINLDVICEGEIYKLKEPHHIQQSKLDDAIEKWKVGSVLNCGGHAYPLSQWHEIIRSIELTTESKSRLKVPVLYGIDAIHGANYVMGSTLFPQQLAQAATFNPELVRRVAEVTAVETRAVGIPWNFSPVLDVGRNPNWSRFFETYGEDPFLCSVMGAGAIRGYQGGDANRIDNRHVAACMKHFLGYSGARTGKDRTPAYLSDIQLREIYMPSFQAAIDAGALTVMINSGEINGIPVHANPKILVELLRNEMHFNGMAVTDWEDVIKLVKVHHVAVDLKEAVYQAVMAGIDMCMVPNDYDFTKYLIELVKEGRISEKRLDESVARILALKMSLVNIDHATDVDLKDKVGCSEHIAIAKQVVAESVTLLQNKNATLPLKKESKIMITGPAAHSLILMNGAWSRTWQGVDSTWEDANKMTIVEGMRAVGGAQVKYKKACELNSYKKDEKWLKSLKKMDVIVACVGELPSTEKPGDIDDLSLEKAQIKFVHDLIKTGKPVVLVLLENRPRLIEPIADQCAAVLMAYQPGDNAGDVLAKMLFGEINPSGKLPFTYPRFNQSLLNYDHKHSEALDQKFGENAYQPQWPFGHGLSYSALKYKNLNISKARNQSSQPTWVVSVEVENISDRDAQESVLLYLHDQVASVTPSVKKLKRFDKKKIAAHSTTVFEFVLNKEDLMFIGRSAKPELEGGIWEVYVGDLKGEIVYQP